MRGVKCRFQKLKIVNMEEPGLLTPVWPDRDNFIWLTSENIAQTNKNDFKKRPFGNARSRTPGSVDTKDTPYDVRSATV